MNGGWKYRLLSVSGTIALGVLAVAVANLQAVQAGFGTLPLVGHLPFDRARGMEFAFESGTTTLVLLAALWPLYKPRPRRILDVAELAVKRVLLAGIALAAIGYFDYTYRLPRATLLVAGVILLVAVPAWFVWIRRRPAGEANTIIVGDDPVAMADIYGSIDGSVMGYVSPPLGRRNSLANGGQAALEEQEEVYISGSLPRLGGLARLEEVLVDFDVDTAYLAFSSSDRAEFFGALDTCHEHGVGAKVHREHVDNVLTEDIGEGAIVDVDIEPLDFQDYVLKRIFDVAFSLGGLVSLSPVILVISIAIKLDSPGPVLYEQERTAEFGGTFSVYKFRSMVPEAEAETGVKLSEEDAGEEDPRVTRVGRFLRQTHLDEIPQLWAILVGQMSTVGPRPERPEWDPQMKESAVEWRKRWFVKPGLTGLAQVNDVTGFEPEEKIRYDIEYIRRQSFWFDMKIVIRQIWIVLGDVVGTLRD